MTRAAGCERPAECSWIDSGDTEVKETGCDVVDEGLFNGNEEE